MRRSNSALRTEKYFRERGSRADRDETLRILKVSGRSNPPAPGDELPKGWKPGGKSRPKRKRGHLSRVSKDRHTKAVS